MLEVRAGRYETHGEKTLNKTQATDLIPLLRLRVFAALKRIAVYIKTHKYTLLYAETGFYRIYLSVMTEC